MERLFERLFAHPGLSLPVTRLNLPRDTVSFRKKYSIRSIYFESPSGKMEIKGRPKLFNTKKANRATMGSTYHWKIKVDYQLLDGKPRATLIQRFDGSAVLLGPHASRLEFKMGATLNEIQAEADQAGWVVAIEHLHKEREGRIG